MNPSKSTFIGVVWSGAGRFSDMVIPGRNDLDSSHPEWPHQLQPGTLNIKITKYPTIFGRKNVTYLDSGIIPPTFIIPHLMIIGNTLPPTDDIPLRGNGQVWRAELIVEKSNTTVNCWVLRRVGSGMSAFLELVSDVHIRSVDNLDNNDRVKVTLFSK